MAYRCALALLVAVACSRPTDRPPSDPVIDDFRAVDRTCRAQLGEIDRQAQVHLLGDEGQVEAVQKTVLPAWKDLAARIDAAPVPDGRRELYATMGHYLGEQQATWKARFQLLSVGGDDAVALETEARTHADAADADARALEQGFAALGLAPLPPLQPDAGVALARPVTAPPGPAFFLVGGQVVRLDPAGFHVIATEMSSMDVLPDGTMWACSNSKVVHWDGTRSKTFTPKISIDVCAAGPDGRLWAIDDHWYEQGPDHLASFDGVTWKVVTATVGDRFEQVRQLAVDRDGTLYAYNNSQSGGDAEVYARVGDAWQQVSLPGSVSIAYIRYLFRGGDGHVWLFYQVTRDKRYPLALAQLTPTSALPPVFVDGGSQVSYLLASIDPAGTATVIDLEHPMIMQGSTRMLPPRGLTWPGPTGPGPFAYDAAGRVWLELEDGLGVLAPDGSLVVYPHGSLDAFTEPIAQIAVVGAGPSLPAPGAVVTRTITGVATHQGKPLAGEPVLLCRASGNSQPLCPNIPSAHQVVTDGAGHFTMTDVPRWSYDLSTRTHRTELDAGVVDQWLPLVGTPCCAGPVDLGPLDARVTWLD